MKTVRLELSNNTEWDELKKIVGFVSEKIQNYHLNNNILEIEVLDETDETELILGLQEVSKKYISDSEGEKILFDNCVNVLDYQHDFRSIHYYDQGMVSLTGQSLFLYDFFNQKFENMVKELFDNSDVALTEKLYPVMLPIHGYKKTGYLKRTPQYAIFCCSAIENMKLLNEMDGMDFSEYKRLIDTPKYALSPSACFHVYEEYKDKILVKNTVVTFTQSVFRNEGRFNFSQFGRMRDYHVREIVFIGDYQFVTSARELEMDAVKDFIVRMEINARMVLASDAFILPKMQKFKKIQKIDKSKYELQFSCDHEEYMSVASFNLHGEAFALPFNIKVDNKDTVTGCIGFGLERFVLAFLSQYGEDSNQWPKDIKEAYYSQ